MEWKLEMKSLDLGLSNNLRYEEAFEEKIRCRVAGSI